MAAPVLLLVAVAAVFHAAWNALLKGSADPLEVSGRAVLGGTALATLPAIALWLCTGRPGLPLPAVVLALVSALLETVYFIFLSEAYRRGELSEVYPTARGTAPLLAVLVGLFVLGERPRALALVGLACLLGGLWLVRPPLRPGSALVPALVTGVMIAAYTAVDRVGVRLGPPWLYGYLLWLFTAMFLTFVTRFRKPLAGGLPEWPRALQIGALMTAAYFLILYALSQAPLSLVSPLRESAIVLVTAWGVFRLRETKGATLRLLGAIVIMVGVVLVTLS
jgi:drug/metabolite transporter (DMT)-like permease